MEPGFRLNRTTTAHRYSTGRQGALGRGGSGIPIALLLSLLAVGVSLRPVSISTPSVESEVNEAPHPLQLDGLSLTRFGPHGVRARVRADSLVLASRPILSFRLRGVRELRLWNARIETHAYSGVENPRSDPLAFGSGEGPGENRDPFPRLGLMTRVVIEPLYWTVHADREVDLAIAADRGVSNRDLSRVELFRARLEDRGSGRQVLAERIVWHRGRGRFRIPGSFVAIRDGFKGKGRAVELDMDLRVQPLEARPGAAGKP